MSTLIFGVCVQSHREEANQAAIWEERHGIPNGGFHEERILLKRIFPRGLGLLPACPCRCRDSGPCRGAHGAFAFSAATGWTAHALVRLTVSPKNRG